MYNNPNNSPIITSVASTDLVQISDVSVNAGQPSRATVQNVVEAATGVFVANVTLTSAQILALFGTPVTVLAAPGAGKAYVIRNVYATKAAGTAYAGVATNEDIAIRYTNASGSIAATLEMTGFADSTAATQVVGVGANCLPVANAAMVAHMTTADIITGNSDFKLRIEYQILDVPAF